MKKEKITNKIQDQVPVIWLILDNRPGNREQCYGVANALGFPFKSIEISYNKLSILPNFFLGSSLFSINQTESDILKNPFPDIIISAGRRAAPVLKFFKNKFGISVITVQTCCQLQAVR